MTHAIAVRADVVAATRERTVDVWVDATLVATIRGTGCTSALHLTPNHHVWVGVGCRGVIELWGYRREPRLVGTLAGHGGAVTGVCVDAEGRLVSASLARHAGQRSLWRSCAPVR